jgi:hypothetical protein
LISLFLSFDHRQEIYWLILVVVLSLEILGFLLAFLNLVTGSGLEILLWELLAGNNSKKSNRYDFISAT